MVTGRHIVVSVLLAVALLGGCSGPAEVPGAATAFAVGFDDERTPQTRADGVAVVQWRSAWVLTWSPVQGVSSYRARFGSTEGISEDGRTRELDEASLRIDAAAGTSVPERVEQDRAAGLLLTSSQLLVSVAAVSDDGAVGPWSAWFSVGDTDGGRPIPVLAPAG